MFILAKKTKHPEKRKKLQPTETKTVLNIIMSAKVGPVFTFTLSWVVDRPLLPSLEIGIKNKMFLEKPEVGILFPIN